jgi:hypothetical protein
MTSAMTVGATSEPVGEPMPNDLLKWIYSNLLTDTQLDVIPPRERTSLRFLIPELNNKHLGIERHLLRQLCECLKDIDVDSLTKAEVCMYNVLHSKELLQIPIENGGRTVKLGKYWDDKP